MKNHTFVRAVPKPFQPQKAQSAIVPRQILRVGTVAATKQTTIAVSIVAGAGVDSCAPPLIFLELSGFSTNLRGMKTCLALLALGGWITITGAQPTNSFPLWPEAAPGALGNSTHDIPTLTPFYPETGKATGAAMVICPGGGYGHLAAHEGAGYARWLAEHGITAFVLKYRLGTSGYRHPAMLHDAARAVRLVRARSGEWHLDPNRIGIIGSSAGGHLASTLLTHFDAGNPAAADPVDRVSSRPDLGILCYAVITLGQFTHQGSKSSLLGTNPPPGLVQELSNELRVAKDTPPCFLWHTVEDKAVPVENSLQFAGALRAAGVPFDLHLYQKGGHGMGLGVREYPPKDGAKLHPWTSDCLYWLKAQGFVK
jgi:acetyl esterase/lipase